MKNHFSKRLMQYCLKSAVILFLLILDFDILLPQESFDTKGKDFWLTFLPNYHNNKFVNDPYFQYGDSLYIFITSDTPTSGRIVYKNINGQQFTQDFNITDPAQAYVFKVCFYDFELLGYNDSGNSFGRNQSERTAPQSFHITSEDEVTVFAHSQAVTTSEGCIVFPTDILGNEYFIMSYNSDGSIDPWGSDLSSSSTPSEFAIVGVEDSTNVIIEPSHPTMYNDMTEQNIIMNRGDVYLVQSSMTIDDLQGDMTGSHLVSDKPIAVFSGHQRATIPQLGTSGSSRDYLIEQMPPLKAWGMSAFLTPFAAPDTVSPQGCDLFRIMSVFDNTEVYINQKFAALLFGKGDFYQDSLIAPAAVTATAPILVAQFKKTSGNSSTMTGDPLMIIIPPVEQFMRGNYKVVNIQAYEGYYDQWGTFNYQKVYTEHYITLVVPQSAFGSILLDGISVDQNNFSQISTSDYYYANIKVNEGLHTIEANSNIEVLVYGYGEANSYGYTGGMGMKQLVDIHPTEPVSISGNYSLAATPNPVTDKAKFNFSIARSSKVKLSIYNLYGKMCKELMNEYLQPGSHEIELSTEDLPQSMYIINLVCEKTNLSRLFIILR